MVAALNPVSQRASPDLVRPYFCPMNAAQAISRSATRYETPNSEQPDSMIDARAQLRCTGGAIQKVLYALGLEGFVVRGLESTGI